MDFIEILIKAQLETNILPSFIKISIKAQSETSILPSFIEISIKAQSYTSKDDMHHANIKRNK